MLHKTFSRRGGLAKSPAKTAANRAKMRVYWADVFAGRRPAPRRYKAPPSIPEIVKRLKPVCEKYGIVRLEVFGSVARGQARRGSDVDLIALFKGSPGGLRFFGIVDDMENALGVKVDLLTVEGVEEMTNPYFKRGINESRLIIYEAAS